MPHAMEIVVPPMGEPIDSARIISWIVPPGQAFRRGDILLEIETDKSVIEVPAEHDGTMLEHLVAVDGLLDADTPIARIQVEGEPAAAVGEEPQRVAATPAPAIAEVADERPTGETISDRRVRDGGRSASDRKFATPAARSLANDLGLGIDAIEGTGPGGRVTRSDVARAARRPGRARAVDGAPAGPVRNRMRDETVSTAHGELCVSVWESGAAANGPTVVFVHGMFGDRSTWAGIAHVVNRAGLRVVAMDLPCHGKSRSETTSLSGIVEAVSETIVKQCPGPVVLVGHSFGGAISAKVALVPNLRIETLIMVAPVGMGTQIEQSFLDGMSYAESNEAMLRELSKLTATGIVPSIAYVDELRDGIRTRRARMIDLCRKVSWNGVQQIDVIRDLATLRCPVKLIQGRRDQIVPWQHVLNAPPRVAIHLLPDAGHMPQWEAAAPTAEIILEAVLR